MQLCSKCSNYNPDDSIFCGHCANRLNNNCPACGFRNLWDQKFCGSCGKQLLSETDLTASALGYGQSGERVPQAAASAPVHPSSVPAMAKPAAVVGGGPISETSQKPAFSAVVQELQSVERPGMKASGMTEEARFETYPELDAYALASIEFVHWDQLLASVADPQQLEAYRRQCQSFLEERIVAAGGKINASKKNILFVSFRQEPSLDASLDKAIAVSLELLAEEFRFMDEALPIRIGLGIEFAKARNPLTSTLERSVGIPGSLTVGEDVYQQVGQRYHMEAVGPITIGKRAMQFYCLLRSGAALPNVEDVLAPSQMDESIARLQESPASAPIETPIQQGKPPLASEQNASVAGVSAVAPEPVPVATKPETQTAPSPESTSAAGQPAGQSKVPLPPLPQYASPVLGVPKAPRSPNLNYETAIDALTSEVSGFLAQGATGKGKVLALCASDGLGKSSIIHMIRGRVDPENQRAIWLGGHNYRCFHRSGLPLYYWIELVQNLLSLVFEGQPNRDVKDQVTKFLSHVYEDVPPEELAFLCELLSVQPPEPISVESRGNLGRIESFFFEFFQNLSTKRPLVIVIEDVMYSDAASLDVLVRLLEKKLLELPVMLVLTHTRDFYLTGKLGDLLQTVQYKELIISELNDAESERFLDDGPLGGKLSEFPPRLIQSVVRAAKGSAMFLEEAMRLLHLRGVLIFDQASSKLILNEEADLDATAMPEQLDLLLRQRLASLDEQSLYILQLASVLGEKFAVNVLMALAQADEAAFNQAITQLFYHGFLLPDAVNTGRFRHGLIWESVYDTIEPELRTQMHQLISETLEQDLNQGLTVNPMLIAYHAENGELPNRALNYWNLAGIYAGQVGSLVGMDMAMFRALALLEEAVPEPLHTQELALRIMESLGIFNLEDDPDLASQMLEWTFYFRKAEGDITKLIEPLGFLASAYEHKGNFPKALVTLEKAVELIDPVMYPLEVASLQINKLEYLYALGRMQQARELMEQVIEPIAEQQGYAQGNSDFFDSYLQARLLKAQVMLAQCDNRAMPIIEECLRHTREHNLEGLTIALQLAMAQFFLRNGQYESCDREADNLLSAIESMEDSDWFLAQWGLLAIMYHCELEDWASASQLVLTVISKSEASHDYLTWVTAQCYAGYISGKLGKVKEARQLIEQSIGLSSDYRLASAALLGWRFLADFELSLGNAEVAYEIAEKALDIAGKPDIRNEHERIQLTLVVARALLAQGKPKEAGKLLEPIWPEVAKTKWEPMIATCALEIGQLYKQLAHNVPSDLSRKYLTRSVEFFLKAKGIALELRNLPMVRKADEAMPKL